MKRILLSLLFMFLLVTKINAQDKAINKTSKSIAKSEKTSKKEVKKLRKKHAHHLANNKINKTFFMTKTERKKEGIPPNKYFEQEWLLSMNPAEGRPTPENLETIRKELIEKRRNADSQRIPGDGADNLWVERGPNNVGGRTKGMIFDPTDATGNTVIAGGVSGGLWKNTNITNATNPWTRITSLPEHLNVQNITVDPNNSSTWFVGTGESYTGDFTGNGIWKTTDAGATWTRIFGGGTVSSSTSQVYNLYITAPSAAAVIRGYSTGSASFGGTVQSFGGNMPIVLVNDGSTAPTGTATTGTTDDACQTLPLNSLSGKIALIRRGGGCTFESKVIQAENAGAIGVIIMNNVPNAGPIGMADSGLGATIPCVSVSKEDGDLLVANLTNLTGDFAATLPGQFSGTAVTGFQYINDIAIKDLGTTSAIYAAVGDSYNAGYHNSNNYGLYKSSDGGSTWTLLTLPLSPSGNKTCPMDIEIAVGGKIWVSSTDSSTFGDGGGKIFVSSNDGNTFTTAHTISSGAEIGLRTEIEASNTTADVIYVCSQISGTGIEVQLLKTTNGFATAPTVLSLPPGNETRENTYGFTGQQAFYNIMIESDPTNDAILYVGGIDLYRSTNSGSSWTPISDWTVNVHSDQHAMAFKPGSPNIGIFGNDGGVYYSNSLSTANSAAARNNGFNVTQFVGVAVKPLGGGTTSGDFFVAGAQDNGSQYFPSSKSTSTGATAGIVGSTEIQGGDGGQPLFKQNATTIANTYYVTNYVYNNNMNVRNLDGTVKKILNNSSEDFGLFYPAMALDSSNDIVYSDASDGTNRVYQVRRYSSYLGGPAATKTILSNSLLTFFPTALNTGKVTPTTLYIGTGNSKLLKVTGANNTAGTWSDISINSGFVGTISDIEFGANDNQIFVTLKNYGTTNIWYTPNGGTNWYNIEGNLPDMPVHTILQNPLRTSELMVGTDLGVWYANTFDPDFTGNQSIDWKQSFNGMSNVKVTDLDLQANSPTTPTGYNVFAATYGRGVFSGQLTPKPANDDCINAEILNLGGDFTSSSKIGLVLGATASEITTPSIPAPGCANYAGGDVWYKATVPANGEITFETGQVTGGISNSGIAVYSGSCNSLTKINCDDDSSLDGAHAKLSITGRTAGETLYVRVWSNGNLLTRIENNQPNMRGIDAAGSGQFKIAAYNAALNTPQFEDKNFVLYPNPIKNNLNISYSKEISKISIFNLLGQEVLSKSLNSTKSVIDLSNLSSGNYIIKVSVIDGAEKTVKIIKE